MSSKEIMAYISFINKRYKRIMIKKINKNKWYLKKIAHKKRIYKKDNMRINYLKTKLIIKALSINKIKDNLHKW